MATHSADDLEQDYPARKKQKTSEDEEKADIPTPIARRETLDLKESVAQAEAAQTQKEAAVGIEVFVSEDAGFSGILKRRYHDFLVNEIDLDGHVVRFDDPKQLNVPDALLKANEEISRSNALANEQDHPARNGVTKDAPSTSSGDVAVEDQPINTSLESVDSETNDELAEIKRLAASANGSKDGEPGIDLSSETLTKLRQYFEVEEIKKLATIFSSLTSTPNKEAKAHGTAESLPVDDKEDRKNVHQLVRTIFGGRIESNHKDGNTILCTAATRATSRKGKSNDSRKNQAYQPTNWSKLGGEYMHFTLYKENRDSGDILGYLASKLSIRNQKIFDMAGNKDRRAVTVQRISAYRVKADRFLHVNNIINQAHVGDCSYHRHRLQLGDLAGNEFIITLRDCAVRMAGSSDPVKDHALINQNIRQSMHNLREKGFVNYYGLQRFGSFATRTDIVGQYMINGDYKAAIDTILEFSQAALEAAQSETNTDNVSRDDKNRALALHWFATKSADTQKILQTLPRRFTAECAIVQFLLKANEHSNQYYRGALEAIPRTTRSLYPHAYQSLIWNLAASHRWRLAPGKVLPGDLVMIDKPSLPSSSSSSQPKALDAQGEPIYEPEPTPQTTSSHHPDSNTILHTITESDISSNKYTVFDIVLPQPGHSITYPSHMLEFYKSTMTTHGGIDPQNMRRNWRDTSLPGAYRKLLGRPGKQWGVETLWYQEADAQIAVTDWDVLEARQKAEKAGAEGGGVASGVGDGELDGIKNLSDGIAVAADITAGERLAVILKFQLPSSTYATMALRELMKPGPVEFKPEFSNGRMM